MEPLDESTSPSPPLPDIGTSSVGENESWGETDRGELYGPIARAIIAMNDRATAALGEDFEGGVLDDDEERYVFGDLFDVEELNSALELIIPQLLTDCIEHQDKIHAVLCGIWTRAMVVGALHERMRDR